MARNSKGQKTINTCNRKPTGPSSDSNAKKTRTMDELLGILAMDFQTEQNSKEEEVQTE